MEDSRRSSVKCFSEPVPDLLDFLDRLESLCPDEYHPDEVVIYET